MDGWTCGRSTTAALREEINGVEVFEGRLCTVLSVGKNLFFERTSIKVAIKVMSSHRIRQGSKEVAAMQHLQRHIAPDDKNQETSIDELRDRVEQGMLSHRVMTSIDVLIDGNSTSHGDAQLYIGMPFCEDLWSFLRPCTNKFSEPEARHWFKQILKAVETLQEAEICHRDISLENIVVRNNAIAVVIDFGMCLKIPYISDANGNRQRCLIKPDRACGKVSWRSCLLVQQRFFAIDLRKVGFSDTLSFLFAVVLHGSRNTR